MVTNCPTNNSYAVSLNHASKYKCYFYDQFLGKRLDCFGVAMLVVATAQCIGYNDIHLVLSEDHAWISFGDGNKETAEVTWHGKRDGVKRGSPISQDSLVGFSKDWLYLGGNGMQCDRFMEVAAVVSAMNPGIDAKTDSEKLSRLQRVSFMTTC